MKRISSRGRAALVAAAVSAVGSISTTIALGAGTAAYSTAGSNYTQNFSTLTNDASGAYTFTPTTGLVDLSSTNNGTSKSSTAIGGGSSTGAPPVGMDGWWYAGTASNKYLTSTSTSGTDTTTGALYNYGDASVEALGLETASGSGDETFGLALLNTSGSTLSTFSLSFDAAVWHYGTAVTGSKTLDFAYEVANATSTMPLLGSGATALSSLDYAATNGSPSGFQDKVGATTESVTAQSLGTGWANGQVLWLTWYMNTTTAQSPGIGIDTLVFNAAAGATTPVLDWNGGNSGNGLIWNTIGTNENWKVNPADTVNSAYADPDVVNFTNLAVSAGGNVAVVAGGVNPGSVNITNTSGKYTFTGGSIGGTGALTENGAGGTAELSNTSGNSYSGGTIVEAGTLIADSDAELGNAAGGITIEGSGATFQSGGNITGSTRNITVTSAGGTFSTPTSDNFTTSGTTAIGGTFNTTGGGNLTLDGAVSVATGGTLNIGNASVTFGQATGTVTQTNSSTYTGNLIVTGTARLNFDSSTGTIGGSIYGSQTGGSIQVTNAGTTAEDSFGDGGVGGVNTNLVTTATITNLSSTAGGTINAPIVLNPSGTSTRGDVTQEFFSPGSFTVSIGGTTGGDGLEIGTLGTSGGGVSGNSDVNIANSPLGGGAGTLILDTTSTYNGTTTINTGNATITEGVTNALPTNTDVIVGTIGNGMLGKPILDLNGNNQTVNSLSNGQYVTATHILTITNNNPDTTSTFTVSGSTTPWEDSASDDEAGYTGAITDGSATGGGVLNFAKGGSSTLVLDNTTYTGTTTVTGGTLILNDPTGLTQLGSGGNFVSTGGGSGNSQVFGGSLIRAIASDASFDGLGSQANGDLNTKADILLGSNSNDSTDDVTMQWRQRDTNETPGTQTTPPSDPTVDGLISDVLNLNLTGTAAPGSESDVFVLQMSFNPGNVVDEAAGAKAGFLRIDWLNPNGGGTGIPEWQNAILGDFATGTDTTSADKNFQGSFATFSADAGGLTDANVSNYLGSWGVDTTDNEVWAILDHNSSFAVVPEPSTALVGLVIGGMGILQRRRRRTKA